MNYNLIDGNYGGLKGPDPHDGRDWRFAHAARAGVFSPPADRPRLVTHERYLPPVYDQGSLGSCTAWTGRTCREFLTLKIGNQIQPLSPLWLYYNTRQRFYPSEVNQDTGAYMRDMIAIVRGRGIAREPDWPYIVSRFAVPPPSASYGPAIWYRNVNSYRIETLSEQLDCLASGWCYVFGFSVWSNFEDAVGDGIVPMPRGVMVGGHAVTALGYQIDDRWLGGGYILARNSWGDWTDDGNLRFPFAFMQDPEIAMDMWALHLRSEDV